MNDRESQLARGITRHLQAGLDDIEPLALSRLRAAREMAVAAAERHPALALAAESGSSTRPGVLQYLNSRNLLPALALLLAIVGAVYWQQSQQPEEMADVDAKLLSGDLPIDAYLDKGLDSWLKRTSH